MITAGMLYDAVTTADWWRYTGHEYSELDGYATAGTHGDENAVDLRCTLTYTGRHPYSSALIEYRPVGTDTWIPTGYRAVMRYDASREHTEDGDGYEFIPYRVTRLTTAP